MSLSSFFRLFGSQELRGRKNLYRGRRPRFERLEDRCYLDATPLDPIEIPPLENPPVLPPIDLTGFLNPIEGNSPPALVDEGQFYWHFDEQIVLHRVLNEFLVRLSPLADRDEIIAGLTGAGAPLAGSDQRGQDSLLDRTNQ